MRRNQAWAKNDVARKANNNGADVKKATAH